MNNKIGNGFRQLFSDSGQKRAAGNIIKFLAALLVLTLVARGTAGATLAKVYITDLARGMVIESVSGSAVINAASLTKITVPEGLTIIEIVAGVGQGVSMGDTLIKLNQDDLANRLIRENSALEGMCLKLEQLNREEYVDTTSLDSARTGVRRAEEDYNTTKRQGESDVANALASLNAALSKEERKRENTITAPEEAEANARKAWEEAAVFEQVKLDELMSAEPAEEAATRQVWEQAKVDTQKKKEALDNAADNARAAAMQEWEAAVAESARARTELEGTAYRAQQDLLSASRRIEDARLALTRAEHDQSKATEQAADKKAQDELDAIVQRQDIEKKKEMIAELQALADNRGILYSEISGVVSNIFRQDGDVTDTEPLLTLADNTGAFVAEFWLDKSEAEKLAIGNECEVITGGGSMYFIPTVSGTISSISTSNEEGLVNVTVNLPEGEWIRGQSVDFQIVQSRNSYDMCVPLSAVHSDSAGYYIFTVEQQNTVLGVENVIIQIPVIVLASDDGSVAISGPVDRNASIVITSNKAIFAGDRVRVNQS